MKNFTENRKSFLDRLYGHFTENDIALIEFAYDLAKEAHRPIKRDTGERYFEHPRAGCLILMDELGIYNKELLIAFLFHDVGEDTPLLGNGTGSYDTFIQQATFRLTHLFGSTITAMVIRLTKPWIDAKRFHTKDEAFSFYLSQLQTDEASLLAKAVDRLHNLRSLPLDKPDKIRKQLVETEHVYLPLFSSITGAYAVAMNILIVNITEQMHVLTTSL